MRRFGDNSLEWILREAADGEIFAAGHGETGNDLPALLSTARADRVDGGYRFYGHKMFGSLTPVWTRLGLHAMDATDPTGPKIIRAFLPRDTPGYRVAQTWDTLGMRATRSDDTILDSRSAMPSGCSCCPASKAPTAGEVIIRIEAVRSAIIARERGATASIS
jgi:alkylation response protein AidB-like acyl-CoA dehydrogenase